MIRILLFTFFVLSFFNVEITAQNTVGLLSYNPMKTFDGYNLIYPHNQPNNVKIHVWNLTVKA